MTEMTETPSLGEGKKLFEQLLPLFKRIDIEYKNSLPVSIIGTGYKYLQRGSVITLRSDGTFIYRFSSEEIISDGLKYTEAILIFRRLFFYLV